MRRLVVAGTHGPPQTVTAALGRAWRGVRWYLKEFTGEANWDRYLEHYAASGSLR
jgi:hypothetical protein